jgi:5-methylthioadenosine/S-adenosylhomocysteine deaminase
MSANRTEVDLILEGDYVVTMNERREVIHGGAVAVTDNTITDVDTAANIDSKYRCAKKINNQGILLPGLINCHTHAAMTLFRGAVDDYDLDDFLQRIWARELEEINPTSVSQGARIAIMEMLRSGITCFVDMYWYPTETAKIADQMGIRLVTGEVFVNFPGADGVESFAERLERAENFANEYRNHPRITPILCPHSTYTQSGLQLKALANLSERLALMVHIHASEAEKEMHTVKEQYGVTPIAVLESAGLLNQNLLIAHGVHIDKKEMQLLADAGVSIAHCPISNMKLASGTAPIEDFIIAGINVTLGTDGAATSNDLNLWAQMRVAALLQKLIRSDPSAMKASVVVEAATLSGARALGCADRLGSLEAGKHADLIGVSIDKPHAQQFHDVFSHLVYAARPDDVETVCIDGNVLVDGGQLMTRPKPAVC